MGATVLGNVEFDGLHDPWAALESEFGAVLSGGKAVVLLGVDQAPLAIVLDAVILLLLIVGRFDHVVDEKLPRFRVPVFGVVGRNYPVATDSDRLVESIKEPCGSALHDPFVAGKIRQFEDLPGPFVSAATPVLQIV